jgi:hypothetical protein
VANAINAETAKRWNQYVWQSQQEANRRYYEKMAAGKQGRDKARQAIYQRLRDDPTPSDIAKGDALNVALDEVNNPSIYIRSLKTASTKLPGTTIRDIPFQYASAAITTSYAQLTKGGPPAGLKKPEFDADRTALKTIAAELRKQNEEKGTFDHATIARAQGLLHALRLKMEASFPRGTRDRTEAEKYLKGLFGLTRMLETPAVNVLLAGVEKRPDTTLGDLLTFMQAFNLRFGAAATTRQKDVYKEIYPLLVKLRDEASSQTAEAPIDAPPLPESSEHPGNFFKGMDLKQLDVPAPPAPGAGKSE